MKLCRLLLRHYLQFDQLDLDLTYPPQHPKAGQPLEKCCFIGRNGTGKSNLLFLLHRLLLSLADQTTHHSAFLLAKWALEEKRVYAWHSDDMSSILLFPETIEESPLPEELYQAWRSSSPDSRRKQIAEYTNASALPSKERSRLAEELTLREDGSALVIYSPPEAPQNQYQQVHDVPQSNLSEALHLFKRFPVSHIVSEETVRDFWKVLIYQIKKREEEYREFEGREENLDRTVREVREEFEQTHPQILEELGRLWNRILERAGLEFDVTGASNPVQLNDNLKAYIRLASTGETIGYHRLSTGIRNFIFRLGHIYALYFQRPVERGFLLIDEPENSLFPDFLYDLVEIYQNIAPYTQLFMATHNPIIAAQFDPAERIILEFGEEGGITTRRGCAPTGDDPNDLLLCDFEVRSIYTKEGQEIQKRRA